MASAFSHALVGLSIGTCFYRPEIPKRIWLAGMFCAALPDLDVIGFRFGIRYGDFWGHRGFTHSLIFAALLSAIIVAIFFRHRLPGISRLSLLAYLFLATASHGVLDAMTNGGLGVAFFSPFNNRRFFLPWRPIRVSPIGTARFFTARGLTIVQNELLWIWIPTILFASLVWLFRRNTFNYRSSTAA
jgi:inner membrane protein